MSPENRAFFKSPATIILSASLGIAWHLIVIALMGGSFREGLVPAFLLAGATAGIVAGWQTINSRRARDGGESFGAVLANYYLAIFFYWLFFVIFARIELCLQQGGWTDFNLDDHLNLIATYLVYGTVIYGICLIPLYRATRGLVWRVHVRSHWAG